MMKSRPSGASTQPQQLAALPASRFRPSKPEHAASADASAILDAFKRWGSDRGLILPPRLRGQYHGRIAEMLLDGIDVALIKRALAAMLEQGAVDRAYLLDSFVIRAQTPPASSDAGGRRTGRDQTVAEWLDFSARLEAAEANGSAPQWAVGA
jgi:hypothetical protein